MRYNHVRLLISKTLDFRYDGRGHLYDLSAYDAVNVKPWHPTEEEKEIEALCEEERWLELKHDIAEKTMYEGWYLYSKRHGKGLESLLLDFKSDLILLSISEYNMSC